MICGFFPVRDTNRPDWFCRPNSWNYFSLKLFGILASRRCILQNHFMDFIFQFHWTSQQQVIPMNQICRYNLWNFFIEILWNPCQQGILQTEFVELFFTFKSFAVGDTKGLDLQAQFMKFIFQAIKISLFLEFIGQSILN